MISSPADHFAGALHRALSLAAAALAGALLLLWPWTGWRDPWSTWLGWPSPLQVVGLVAFVAAAGSLWQRRWLGKLLAVLSLGAVFASHRVLTMGDGHWWRTASREGTVTWAEPWSSHLQAVLYRLGGPAALEWLPVVCGMLATWVWLSISDELVARGGSSRRTATASALLWASGGVHSAFFHRYVEHSQIGVPLLLLGLAALTRWSRAVAVEPAGSPTAERDFRCGALALLSAALLHLQYSGMFVAAVGAAWIVGWRHGVRRSLRRLLEVWGAVAVAAGATVALFRCGPFTPFFGSVGGGADQRLLTPFVDAQGSWTGGDALFGTAHLGLTASLLVVAVPVAVPFFVALLLPRSRARAATELVASSAAFAWLLFVSLYGFDLGWPTDADLMLCMSVALCWWVAGWLLPVVTAATGARLAAISLGLVLAVVATWAVIAPLVRPLHAVLSQPNSARAELLLDGVASAAGPGPFRVPAAIGATFTLRARGAPGREFWILRGPPSPAVEGHPYGGVADIVVELQPANFVHAGRFAADGTATAAMVLQALPDGTLPGIQMIVFEQPGTTKSITSAAYYFVAAQ